MILRLKILKFASKIDFFEVPSEKFDLRMWNWYLAFKKPGTEGYLAFVGGGPTGTWLFLKKCMGRGAPFPPPPLHTCDDDFMLQHEMFFLSPLEILQLTEKYIPFGMN